MGDLESLLDELGTCNCHGIDGKGCLLGHTILLLKSVVPLFESGKLELDHFVGMEWILVVLDVIVLETKGAGVDFGVVLIYIFGIQNLIIAHRIICHPSKVRKTNILNLAEEFLLLEFKHLVQDPAFKQKLKERVVKVKRLRKKILGMDDIVVPTKKGQDNQKKQEVSDRSDDSDG